MRGLVVFVVVAVVVALCLLPTGALATPVGDGGDAADKVVLQALGGACPASLEPVEYYVPSEVVYDSRYDEEAVLLPSLAASSYSYYKTIRSAVTCSGTGNASSSILRENINFYVNAYFDASGNCISCDKPVVTGLYNGYGVTGYSNAAVTVTSRTSHQIRVRGTCTLTIAHIGYAMSGTRAISV